MMTVDQLVRRQPVASNKTTFDAIVVGAGFAGMYMLIRLRELDMDVRVLEAGSDVGGTWYWNRYPGARCDVDSLEYSYSFSEQLQQEWQWSHRYSTQPEILKYAQHVADRFDLYRDISFDTKVTSAVYDEQRGLWRVTTNTGDALTAKFCIMATGNLSAVNMPHFKDFDRFKGNTYHTGNWPHEGVDFTGKVVGVIGTGSSGIQLIPHVAKQAKSLYVFQRTPNFSIPAKNCELTEDAIRSIKGRYQAFRSANRKMPDGFGSHFDGFKGSARAFSPEDRETEYQRRWEAGGFTFFFAYDDLLTDKEANDTAAEFVRAKIRSIVKDPAVATLLSPEQVIGCKRPCMDTDYFETYNRENVTLVDVKSSPIIEFTETGLKTVAKAYALDCVVMATGFDALTGALTRIDIRGRNNASLAGKWTSGPSNYLGVAVHGFPNFFYLTGPGSPAVFANVIVAIEEHVNWVADCISSITSKGYTHIEADARAEEDWVSRVEEVASSTLYSSCDSYYLGSNIPGKSRVFSPYIGYVDYLERIEAVAKRGYEGFILR